MTSTSTSTISISTDEANAWIQNALQQHLANEHDLDETVLEYLQQLLLTSLFQESENERVTLLLSDNGHVDDEDLIDTMTQFLMDHGEGEASSDGDESSLNVRSRATHIVQAIVKSAAKLNRLSKASSFTTNRLTVTDDMQTASAAASASSTNPPRMGKFLGQELLLNNTMALVMGDVGSATKVADAIPVVSNAEPVKQNRIAQRKERRKKAHVNDDNLVAQSAASTTVAITFPDTSTEDTSSAWQHCLDTNRAWGGRGQGGRGHYAGRTNSVHGTIHLSISSLSLDNGTELLHDTSLDIVKGHRYGLIGRNGVGKSTLLRRLATRTIPGMPHGMRVLLVEQSLHGMGDATSTIRATESMQRPHPQPLQLPHHTVDQQQLSAIEALVQSDRVRTALLHEQKTLESSLEDGGDQHNGDTDARHERDDDALAADVTQSTLERLSAIAAELEAMNADTAHVRAETILEGLQFTEAMRHGSVTNLSGGWRMRLSLAQALFLEESTDLHVWDEVSNHLDLHGLDWLINYINAKDKDELTLIVVSHDRTFLDAICTDIIVLEHQRLTQHVGNYSAYQQHEHERATRQAQILDAAERQRSKAQAFCDKQQSLAHKKSADPNKLRQAKMIRDKKLERIGNYRDDGKRYKLRSLKTLDESSARLAQKVTIETDDAIAKIYFPNPTWPPSVASGDTIVRMEDLSFGYNSRDDTSSGNSKLILNNVTLNIQRGSKIALVGPNGSGKSSLIKLILGNQHNALDTTTKGSLWLHPNLRIGYISQYTVEQLGSPLSGHAHVTVADYAVATIKAGRASSKILSQASGNIRQYLGAFGLGGAHALRPLGKLSGGELMRLSFALTLADGPGLLLLDEANNHVAMETLEAMAMALNAFDGSVVMVSHNQAFLSGFCQELWVLDKRGHISVVHPDTDGDNEAGSGTFDALFSAYRHRTLYGGASSTIKGNNVSQSEQRQRQKAALAKRATTQRQGARQSTALL